MTDTKKDIYKANTIGVILMSDLISRKELLRQADYMENEHTRDVIRGLATMLPSAQPEQKKGKWKLQTIKGKDIVYCSECCFGVHEEETRRYNYCPYCGLKMFKDGD